MNLLITEQIYKKDNNNINNENENDMIKVQQNWLALQFVENQTEEICELAIKQNWRALQFVKEQTEEICKLAVQQDESALMYIKKNFTCSENKV